MGWTKKDGTFSLCCSCFILCPYCAALQTAKVEIPLDQSQYAMTRKNLAAGTSDLLAWKTAPAGANDKSHALTTWKQGNSSTKAKVKEGASPEPGFTKANYTWSARKKEQFSGGCPFGKEVMMQDGVLFARECKEAMLSCSTLFCCLLLFAVLCVDE